MLKNCVSCEAEDCVGCVHAENELDEKMDPNSPQGCESDLNDDEYADIDPNDEDDEDNYSDDPECDYPHDEDDDDEDDDEDDDLDDMDESMDGDAATALASAGFGTDESYRHDDFDFDS